MAAIFKILVAAAVKSMWLKSLSSTNTLTVFLFSCRSGHGKPVFNDVISNINSLLNNFSRSENCERTGVYSKLNDKLLSVLNPPGGDPLISYQGASLEVTERSLATLNEY